MKKIYIFTDTITKESFKIECEPHQVHNIEQTNKELGKWCEGRIILRTEHEKISLGIWNWKPVWE